MTDLSLKLPTAPSRTVSTSATGALMKYLAACGGQDTLHFDTVDAAATAATSIRSRIDTTKVKCEAQYLRVILANR